MKLRDSSPFKIFKCCTFFFIQFMKLANFFLMKGIVNFLFTRIRLLLCALSLSLSPSRNNFIPSTAAFCLPLSWALGGYRIFDRICFSGEDCATESEILKKFLSHLHYIPKLTYRYSKVGIITKIGRGRVAPLTDILLYILYSYLKICLFFESM